MKLYFDFLFVAGLFIYNYSKNNFHNGNVVFLLLGLCFYITWIVARIQLGKYFTTLPKAQGLITKGLYSKFRNPIYLFSVLSIFCAVVPSNNAYQYSFLVVLIMVQVWRSHSESKILEKKFEEKYRTYKSRVWF